MFIKKNKYYIYIENLRSINLNLVKTKGKFNLIYRNNDKRDNINNIIQFIKLCKKKYIKFFIYNDVQLAFKTGASGVYFSSYNNHYFRKNIKNVRKFEIIGSAHSFKEIRLKIKQGCEKIILSRLFKTEYKNKKSFYGVTRFNLITKNYFNDFVALGGIKSNNLMKLQIVKCEGVALLSEVKKKPAIIRRLF